MPYSDKERVSPKETKFKSMQLSNICTHGTDLGMGFSSLIGLSQVLSLLRSEALSLSRVTLLSAVN